MQGLAGGGVAGLLLLRRTRRVGRHALVLAMLLGAMAAAGLAGWRAADFAKDALRPAIEGRDLRITGVVAKMPQRNEGGACFTFEPESVAWADATADGGPPEVPPRISLGWYARGTGLWERAPEAAIMADASGAPATVHAGERWRLTVRLKAPHGNLNPHGFDDELRLWELGEQATGYVRTGARDAAPERIGVTWRHPVERLREACGTRS